ncbi:MAG TPA: MoxR family ATPase, partial [Vicinamibacterales bacterium]|nr:MoxR family ATPase [Vicinamibacterales bacterium]
LIVRATTNQAGDMLPLGDVRPCMDGEAVSAIQTLAGRQQVDEQVIDYAVRIARATRAFAGLAIGSGPRGALALVRGARAAALLDGRGYVTPDDVKRVALPALRHRVALSPDAMLEGRSANDLLADILDATMAPRA